MNKELPSEVDGGRNLFDRFADAVASVTAKAWFFAACVLLVVLWVPSIFIVGTVDTWQLIINTATTIVTFLLVGLMQNTAARENAATQQKLNAMALALAQIIPDGAACDQLREAFGLENRESA